MAKKMQVKSIPYENIINIQISGAYYMRIQNLLFSLMGNFKEEDLKDFFTRLQNNNNEFKDSNEYNLATILILINEIELQAKEQNKITDQEVELPEDEKAS
jgi:hypothetical protein